MTSPGRSAEYNKVFRDLLTFQSVTLPRLPLMEPSDDEKETIGFRFKQKRSAVDLSIPFHGEVADAIDLIALMGNAALLAFLLKMVLKDRITDDEIQLICDVYYHDEA